jgi:hypothetical protein
MLKFSENLRQMAWTGKMDERKINFVPLVRALEWAEMYPENSTKKNGQEWMGEFFQRLTNDEIPGAQAEVRQD